MLILLINAKSWYYRCSIKQDRNKGGNWRQTQTKDCEPVKVLIVKVLLFWGRSMSSEDPSPRTKDWGVTILLLTSDQWAVMWGQERCALERGLEVVISDNVTLYSPVNSCQRHSPSAAHSHQAARRIASDSHHKLRRSVLIFIWSE